MKPIDDAVIERKLWSDDGQIDALARRDRQQCLRIRHVGGRNRRNARDARIARSAHDRVDARLGGQARGKRMGFSFSGAASNTGLMFARLKPFDQRKGPSHSLQAIIGRISGPLFSLPGAIVVAFTPPSIPGLSRFGGFEFQVLDQEGTDINRLAQATQALVGAGNQSGQVRGLFSSFTANDPQLQVTINRQRALALGLSLDEVTNALQVFLGSQYVNDFEFNNRAYRVYVQADQQFRASPQALKELYARTQKGTMVPLEQVVTLEETTAPSVISHFNLFRAATINGSAAPGVSSGQALKAMEDLATRTLPQGMSYAWSGISLEETKAGRQSFIIFGLALLLVYLTLAAQYESLVLPFIVLLGVPLAVLGALSAQWIRGLANDVYCQVGLVMDLVLVGNAIIDVPRHPRIHHLGFLDDRDKFDALAASDLLIMGRNGRAYVRKNYRWDVILSKYERMFAKLRGR